MSRRPVKSNDPTQSLQPELTVCLLLTWHSPTNRSGKRYRVTEHIATRSAIQRISPHIAHPNTHLCSLIHDLVGVARFLCTDRVCGWKLLHHEVERPFTEWSWQWPSPSHSPRRHHAAPLSRIRFLHTLSRPTPTAAPLSPNSHTLDITLTRLQM